MKKYWYHNIWPFNLYYKIEFYKTCHIADCSSLRATHENHAQTRRELAAAKDEIASLKKQLKQR